MINATEKMKENGRRGRGGLAGMKWGMGCNFNQGDQGTAQRR